MILAIDPGSAKTGVAFVEEDGHCRMKQILPTEALETELSKLLSVNFPRVVVMGNGTHHREIQKRMEIFLRKENLDIPVEIVDEKHTTEMGEARWKQDHPGKGLARFLPDGLRSPEEPVDDYVAWILGQIYLGQIKTEDVKYKK